MRKGLAFFLAVVLTTSLVACGTNEEDRLMDQPEEIEVTNPTHQDEDIMNDVGGTTDDKSHDNQDAADEAPNKKVDESDKTTNEEDMQQKMDALNYMDFELEVEYADNIEYEVELERKRDGRIKAKIEDERKGVKREGTIAFNEIYPLIKELTIDQKTSKGAAIQEVLNVFGLPGDYKEIEIEITFKDGSKVEFKDRQ